MAVFLVRHGHAGTSDHGDPSDRYRSLSATGRSQAQAIARRFALGVPLRIMSSPYPRCVETVTPLAAHVGVDIELCDAFREGETVAAEKLLRFLVASESALDIVICTHGDVLIDLLLTVSLEDGLPIDLLSAPRFEKGSFWRLEAAGGAYRDAVYHPPERS